VQLGERERRARERKKREVGGWGKEEGLPTSIFFFSLSRFFPREKNLGPITIYLEMAKTTLSFIHRNLCLLNNTTK
jgi:hypothetical protein